MFPVGMLVWDNANEPVSITQQAATPRRKPETGEQLDGTRKQRGIFECYFCSKPAHTVTSANVPSCVRCVERYRRRE